MEVLDVQEVKGRGTVLIVDARDVPVGRLRIGSFITQGGRSWRLTGVEMRSPTRPDDYVGLVVQGDGLPDEGEVEYHGIVDGGGGILSGLSIRREVELGRIEIDPWDPTHVRKEDRINPASYDLTLGSRVAVYKAVVNGNFKCDRHGVPGKWLIPGSEGPVGQHRLDAAKENPVIHYEMDERGLLLRPGIGYLMHTVERIRTDHYVPIVDGKSSIGRLFVTAHVTAGFGDPGFDGQYTLEVVAVHPTVVYPGMRFCQMRFHTIVGEVESYEEKGSYRARLANGPVPSQSWRMFRARESED